MEIVANGNVLSLAHKICLLLLGYGKAFVGVALGGYFWLKRDNQEIKSRYAQRQGRVLLLTDAGV